VVRVVSVLSYFVCLLHPRSASFTPSFCSLLFTSSAHARVQTGDCLSPRRRARPSTVSLEALAEGCCSSHSPFFRACAWLLWLLSNAPLAPLTCQEFPSFNCRLTTWRLDHSRARPPLSFASLVQGPITDFASLCFTYSHAIRCSSFSLVPSTCRFIATANCVNGQPPQLSKLPGRLCPSSDYRTYSNCSPFLMLLQRTFPLRHRLLRS
jgi:hypothetical protein